MLSLQRLAVTTLAGAILLAGCGSKKSDDDDASGAAGDDSSGGAGKGGAASGGSGGKGGAAQGGKGSGGSSGAGVSGSAQGGDTATAGGSGGGSATGGSGGTIGSGGSVAGGGGDATSGGSGGSSAGGAGGGSSGSSGVVLAPGFSEGAPIDASIKASGDPLLAMSLNGDAFVAWAGYDKTHISIWAVRYDGALGTWGQPALLETGDQSDAELKDLSIDEQGNAFVAWMQGFIFVSRYDLAAGSWAKAVQMEDHNDGGVDSPRIAAGPGGAATLVWSQSDGSRSAIRTSRYDPASDAWSYWEAIDDNKLYGSGYAAVATDPAGDAVAAWSQSDGVDSHLLANRYDATLDTWGDAVVIEPDGIVGGPVSITAAVDSDGNFFIAWAENPPELSGDTVLWAARYQAGSGWEAPVKLEDQTAFATTEPHLSVDGKGGAMVVWTADDHLWGVHYDAGSAAWSSPIQIDTAPWVAKWASVAVDGDGNAIAVSADYPTMDINAPLDVVVRTYDAGQSQWSAGGFVERDAATVSGPTVGMDSQGRALVVWRHSGDDSLWASVYQPN